MALAQTVHGSIVLTHQQHCNALTARLSIYLRPQAVSHRKRIAPVCVYTPIRPVAPTVRPGAHLTSSLTSAALQRQNHHVTQSFDSTGSTGEAQPLQAPAASDSLITHEAVLGLEAQLDNGASIEALRRFDRNLRALTLENWEAKLRPVLNELAYNLESFNPAFTAVLLKVQCSIGHSDYVRRDVALEALIQPLAGEYGMHNSKPQEATHRQLFSDWYSALMGQPLQILMGEGVAPVAGQKLFGEMMRDIMGGGGLTTDLTGQACYAMGYNLAIEYMADYEKTWMLAAFRHLNKTVLAPNGRALTEWLFLEVHAEGDFAEAEHAALGHRAVTSFVPASAEPLLRAAMLDHDRDFAAFYNRLADMLE